MVSCQGVQNGLLVFVVGEFGAFEIFIQNDIVLQSLIFYISSTGNIKYRTYLDRIWSYPSIY